MVARPDLRNERGAEILEAALVLPLIAIAFLAAVQVAIVAFSGFALSSQITHASWNVDARTLSMSIDPDKMLRDELLKTSIGLVPDNLEVRNTTIALDSSDSTSALRDADDPLGLGLSEFYHARTTATIEADVAYRIPMLLSADGVILERHIEHVQVISERMEVR